MQIVNIFEYPRKITPHITPQQSKYRERDICSTYHTRQKDLQSKDNIENKKVKFVILMNTLVILHFNIIPLKEICKDLV